MVAWRPNLALLAFITVIFSPYGQGLAGTAPVRGRRICVHVDSVVASDTNEGVDKRLATMGERLHSLFSYSTYRLVSHQDTQTEIGNLISFNLPGGRILHVQPREVVGDMISMELVLFQGERPLMTTDLKLRDHGMLIVGGPRYEQGMLIISIGAETGPGHTTSAEAEHPGR